MEPTKYTVLVADDQELTRNLMVEFLSKMGYSCVTATDDLDALEKLRGVKFDAVITDIKMPAMDGMDLAMAISRESPEVPVMITTGDDEEFSMRSALSVGALEFIHKPFSLFAFDIRLRKMIENCERLKRVKAENIEDRRIKDPESKLEQVRIDG